MIDVRIELWIDINNSIPYLTIEYANNQNVIKLLYSNWCHYSPLIPSSINILIPRKNKLIKGKKTLKLPEILSIDSGIPLSKSEVHGLIFKRNQLDKFPPSLSPHLNSNYFYEEKYKI